MFYFVHLQSCHNGWASNILSGGSRHGAKPGFSSWQGGGGHNRRLGASLRATVGARGKARAGVKEEAPLKAVGFWTYHQGNFGGSPGRYFLHLGSIEGAYGKIFSPFFLECGSDGFAPLNTCT